MKTSRYYTIWKQLKEKGSVRVTAPPVFHRRIVKGVKKQRDADTEYRFLLAENNRTHNIVVEIKDTVISFSLTERITLNGI